MEDNNKSADVRELRLEIARLRTENQKLKNSNRRWMRIAGTDIHTGLPNKVFFSNVLLPKQISNANAEKQSIGCIMLAPDGLGEINERYGRRGGDSIVKEVAEFLKESVEFDERVVHIDGANFVILQPEANLQRTRRKGLALRAKISNRNFEIDKNPVALTLRMGGVVRSKGPTGNQITTKEVVEDFLRRLQIMLDQAKQQGGNRIEVDEETHF